MHSRCAGFTAIETIVASGLMALVIGALGSAMLAQSHSYADGAIADALATSVRDEARIAADALKYNDSVLVPASIATSLPMPVGSPIPITMSLTKATLADGSLEITVRAISDGAHGAQSRSTTVRLQRRMPIPGASVLAPSPVAAPLGAP